MFLFLIRSSAFKGIPLFAYLKPLNSGPVNSFMYFLTAPLCPISMTCSKSTSVLRPVRHHHTLIHAVCTCDYYANRLHLFETRTWLPGTPLYILLPTADLPRCCFHLSVTYPVDDNCEATEVALTQLCTQNLEPILKPCSTSHLHPHTGQESSLLPGWFPGILGMLMTKVMSIYREQSSR